MTVARNSTSRLRDGCVIVTLRGELDIASAPALREELAAVLESEASRLVIDLSAIRYADTSGIAVLVGSLRRAGLLGGWLRLAAPTPAITQILAVTGLNQHFATFPTVETAIIGPRPVALSVCLVRAVCNDGP